MKCNYNNDGECFYPVTIRCKDECPYRDLFEEYTTLKQTYDACYKEHIKVVEQNKQLQAQYNRLLEETRLTS